LRSYFTVLEERNTECTCEITSVRKEMKNPGGHVALQKGPWKKRALLGTAGPGLKDHGEGVRLIGKEVRHKKKNALGGAKPKTEGGGGGRTYR